MRKHTTWLRNGPKTLTDTSPKKINRWWISIQKDASYVTGERQTKTTMKYHYTPIRMAKIQNTDNNKCCRGCGTTGIHCWWEGKVVWPCWKTIWQFLTKLNVVLTYNPATALCVIYPKELEMFAHTKTCAQIFIAALFIIPKTWKQSRFFQRMNR